MPETIKKPNVEVRLMTDQDSSAVSDFFRVVWDADSSPEKVRLGFKQAAESNPFFPGQPPLTILFLSENRVLGYCGSIPVEIWNGSEASRAEWVKGLMVLPENRNGPIGFLLVKDLLRQLEWPMSLVVGEAPRRIFGALGMIDLGLVPNFLRLLKTGNVLRKLNLEVMEISGRAPVISFGIRMTQRLKLSSILGGCLALLVRMRIAFSSAKARGIDVEIGTRWPEKSELDDLWHRARNEIEAAPVRDGRYIPRRYGDGSLYGAVTARSNGQLLGVAAVRRPRSEGDSRLSGIHLAVLSDLLFPPHREDVASALLGGAETLARPFGAEAILCSASHAAMTSQLLRHGYFRVPGNMHFMLADKEGQRGFPRNLSSWWIMRGDSSADEVF